MSHKTAPSTYTDFHSALEAAVARGIKLLETDGLVMTGFDGCAPHKLEFTDHHGFWVIKGWHQGEVVIRAGSRFVVVTVEYDDIRKTYRHGREWKGTATQN